MRIIWITVFLNLLACSPKQLEVTVFQLSMPLTLSQAEYRFARITQLDSSYEFVLNDNGSIAAKVIAGLPVTIEVTAIGVENEAAVPAIAAYFGSSTIIPVPGTMEVALNLTRAAEQRGSVLPVYQINGETFSVNTNISITDTKLGITFTTLTVSPSQVFAIPRGRTFTLSVVAATEPTGTASIEIAGSEFAPQTILPITPPILPQTSLQLSTSSNLNSEAVAADTRLIFECVEAQYCNKDLAYASTIPLAGHVDGTYTFSCRYPIAPDLCFAVNILIDQTPPTITLTATPPYIPEVATPMSVYIKANEPIAPTAVQLSAAGVDLCAAPISEDATTVRCDFSSTALSYEYADIVATAADALGNSANATIRLRAIQGKTLAIIGTKLYPEHPAANTRFFLGIDLAGFNNTCIISALAPSYTLDAMPTGISISPNEAIIGSFLPIDVDLRTENNGDPGIATHWVELSGHTDLIAGDYTFSFNTNVTSCGIDTATFTVHLGAPPPTWALGSGNLVYSEWAAGQILPFPIVDTNSTGPDYTTSNRSVIEVATTRQGIPTLKIVGRGQATVTAYPTGQTTNGSAANFSVVAGPALAFLESGGTNGWVVTTDSTRTTRTLIQETIGQPLRLLWEPTSDELIVVGTLGIEMMSSQTVIPVVTTTQTVPIVDAAIAPNSLAGQQAQVLVLRNNGTGSELYLSLVDITSQTVTDPQTIVSDYNGPYTIAYLEMSKDIAIYASDFGAWYRLNFSTATYKNILTTSAHPFVKLFIDPTTGYLAGRANLNGGTPIIAQATTIGLSNPQPEPFIDNTSVPLVADAMAIDIVNGTPLIANINGSDTSINRYKRFDRSWQGSYTISNIQISHLLADATDRVGFAVSNTIPAQLSAFNLDDGTTLPIYVTPPAFGDNPIIDAVLRAPQLASISLTGTTPGSLVTLGGTYFAGDGSDQVYIQGIRATIVSYSPNAIVARIPSELANIPFGDNILVGIRSHGRLVQSLMPTTFINGPLLTSISTPSDISCTTYCPGLTTNPKVLTAPFESLQVILNTTGFITNYGGSDSLLAGGALSSSGFLGDGRRAVAIDASTTPLIYDIRPNLSETRSWNFSHTPYGDIVADPSNRLFAVGYDIVGLPDDAIVLYWTTNFDQAAGLINLSGSVDAYAFTPDGNTLVAIGSNTGTLLLQAADVSQVFDASSNTTDVTVNLDLSTCPNTSINFSTIQSYSVNSTKTLLVALGNSSELYLGTITTDTNGDLNLTCAPPLAIGSIVRSLKVTPSGRYITVNDSNGQVWLISPSTPRISNKVNAGSATQAVSSMAFSHETTALSDLTFYGGVSGDGSNTGKVINASIR